MKAPNRLQTAIVALSVLLSAGAVRAETCEPIRFERGEYSGTVRGVAPPEGILCYTLGTGAGQRAEVRVTGRNVFFSIRGVVDVQDHHSFTTEKKTYEILVGQLMRSLADQPFALTVTVR